MKYVKPLVMDLSARSVDGENHVDVCFNGATAAGLNPQWGEDCAVGGVPSAYSGGYCAPGTAVPSGGCYAGGGALLCNSGQGDAGTYGKDFGCSVGPSFVG